MKYYRLIVLILLVGLIATACQKFSGEGISSAQVPASGASIPYPVSDQPVTTKAAAYPAPVSSVQSSLPVTLYPELKDGDILEWQHVEGTIYSGLVSRVSQTHDLQVTITMKDGRTFVTTEPAIDDIVKLIQQCGDFCKDIRIATE
jgi:hypothetical protein